MSPGLPFAAYPPRIDAVLHDPPIATYAIVMGYIHR
jgi:hypothetical protein